MTKKKIGYLDEHLHVNEKMTLNEILHLVNDIKYNGSMESEIDMFLHMFDLYSYRNQKVSECSSGMKKKLGIIIAFMGEPQLIVLDEPTNALDTKGIILLKQLIEKASVNGSIVIVSSHILDFVTKVFTKCIFLRAGQNLKIVDTGTDIDLEKVYKELYFQD